jgi:hypothetical protein
MSNTECHIEFDGRLWDVKRLLKSGQTERARVETALLTSDAQAAGHDWVADELQDLWETQKAGRRSA